MYLFPTVHGCTPRVARSVAKRSEHLPQPRLRTKFPLSVAAAAQPEMVDGAKPVQRLGATNAEAGFLGKTAKHHWYGDTSPWTEQRHKDDYGFRGARSRPAEEVVILDQENPPQPPSARTVESED